MSKGINHNSNGKQKRLQKLVWSIRSKLEEVGNGSHQSEAIIQKIDDVNTNNIPAIKVHISGTNMKTCCWQR